MTTSTLYGGVSWRVHRARARADAVALVEWLNEHLTGPVDDSAVLVRRFNAGVSASKLRINGDGTRNDDWWLQWFDIDGRVGVALEWNGLDRFLLVRRTALETPTVYSWTLFEASE